MSESENLTLQVLVDIRDDVRGVRQEIATTNQRVDQLRVETIHQIEGLREETTRRLDHVVEGQVRLATEVADLRGEVADLRGEVGGLREEVGELRKEVRRQGDRLENTVTTGGQVIHGLRVRIERLERHTGLEPI